jgi:conjugative relaxase-like TrwC/TraI family protein
MIRMIQSNDAGHAKSYFSDALSKSDYYASDQELAGYWEGRLAARIGLRGATTKEDFFALCENRNPITGGGLTPLNRENRRTGYDINFHCPKSVSVLHAFAQNDHILNAFRDSVTETMRLIEADAMTRIRKGGVYDDRKTGELLWGHFVHQTARPVEGYLPDPHLHSHCFVFNATWDDTEQRIKAGQFHDIKQTMPTYQAHFHMVLSRRLMDLGYQVRRTAKSFEVVGVPEKVLGLFSKRTDEIGRIAKEKGITDAAELSELGARTRAKKQKGVSMGELVTAWRLQVNALGRDGLEDRTTVRAKGKSLSSGPAAEQCIDHALTHCFERASVVADRKLLETAYRFAIGSTNTTPADIDKAFKADKRIIHVREKSRFLCTTKEVLAEEKRMVDLARQGQGKMKPLYNESPPLSVTGQAAVAIDHILTTNNRVSIVRGAAGSGKTTLMTEAVRHIEAAGKKVTTIAPTASASRGVLRNEGFKEAETVAKFLTDKKMQESIKGQVIWVDEAGLLGTKDMLALLEVASSNNARLILGGDTRQHASVVRGDAMRVLNTVAGIQAAEVSKIYRQKNEDYRAAVQDLADGKIAAAFQKLNDMQAIKEIDPLTANKQLASDYMAIRVGGKSALVVAPTHAQGEAVTDEIRERLRADGFIGKKEAVKTRLVNLNLTEAQKADHHNFAKDQVVQFGQNVTGFKRGSLWRVDEVHDGKVKLASPAGEIKLLPTDKAQHYDVYALREIALSKGDEIRITKGGTDNGGKRLDNGDRLEVLAIRKDKVKLINTTSKTVFELDNDFGHIAHAYCVTSHASQGKTVDKVLVSMPEATFSAVDAKAIYVSVSRGKEAVYLYTDDKEALLKHASDMNERTAAVELLGKKKTKSTDRELRDRQRKERRPDAQKTKGLNKENDSYEREV